MSLERKMKRRAKRRDFKQYIDEQGNHVTPLDRNAMRALREAKEAFVKRFGREPLDDEPLLFDPDFDTPTPYSEEKLTVMMVAAMREAGTPEHLIYAWEKTGLILTEKTYKRVLQKDRDDWDAAMAEYFSKQEQGKCP